MVTEIQTQRSANKPTNKEMFSYIKKTLHRLWNWLSRPVSVRKGPGTPQPDPALVGAALEAFGFMGANPGSAQANQGIQAKGYRPGILGPAPKDPGSGGITVAPHPRPANPHPQVPQDGYRPSWMGPRPK
jgi:hypothetical protein